MTSRYDRTFDLLDANANGVLEEKDFTTLAERIAQAAGVVSSAKEEALLKEWRRCWTILREHADTDFDGVISRDEFRRAMAGAYGGRAGLQERLAPGLAAEFAAMDGDDDGIATVEQFEALLLAFGLEPVQARAARAILDTDGDGRITREEYLNGWTDFLLGGDSGSPVGALPGESA
ncbi:EF-hand domain-containing protein [Streptomyces sp. NBC_01006]|uniref:EF-hand domain-containing protein n=1 Tax=Streptomyces sp. NBC_01006 TaxID=2903716 RepID=UPI00386BCC42|nr:EF-hand domain-containing protein [Streptomyces sp. NBC_01006]